MGFVVADHLVRVGQYFHYKRRVPRELQRLDIRGVIQRSTKTGDRAKALSIARRFDDETEQYWDTLRRAGRASSSEHHRYEAALNRARTLGFDYRTVHEIAEGPLEHLLERIEHLAQHRLVQSAPAVEALLEPFMFFRNRCRCGIPKSVNF